MTKVIHQHFHGPVYGGVAGRDVEHSLPGLDSVSWAAAAETQDDFHKRTGIWCPVEAQEALLALRGKSQSPSFVRLAWNFGYIKWDDNQARLRYAVKWTHMAAACVLAAGLGVALFYLVPVGLASTPTARWVGVFVYWALLFLVELVALELTVLRPWKVARMVQRADAEHAEKAEKSGLR